MRKVLVIDSRRYLHEDLRMQLIVNGTEEQYRITAYSPKDPETLKTYMNGKLFDLVLIEHAELESRCDPSCFGDMKLYGYSVSRDAPVLFDAKGIPFMGCAPKAEDLLRIIGEIYDGKTPEPADNPAAAELSSAPPVPESPPRPAPEASPLRGNMILQTQLKKAEQPYQAMDTAGPPEEKTRCIAVWSAKGGVGKSTIAANLALYLSMIPHGRGLYKVCLVDYNIESGDIRTILGIQGDHLSDMSLWADEIHLQLARGRRPEDITFSQTRIAEYLETSDAKTGLSVLLAPELHEKAQFIETKEIQVMLSNIIRFGGFDFVICDTADNTSDGSFCALEMADLVLMVCTQDITTANRNDSVLRSLKHSGIDTSKFRTVINAAASKRKSGISTAEVEEFFKDYECVGRIRENADIQHANNYSRPLVYKPRHEFRADMEKIVRYILEEPEKKTEKKKKLFGR